ncbi:hypothetical protein ACVWWI_006058 [Bradyrhizobium sp. USDA 3686]|uniref:O-antigen polymerase n=1 Tax=Bradyrhizobium TaxID=374 RepID=UPI00195D8ED7|nr:O-antigen polymerase [Bradyrhizobium canariense]MBM7488391.1 hypothetical protein [Bradyrhizobium canariense]UFW71064.1 oligosaccharide repeat unit polymerase [Bradyrhizobium canariense]
MRLGMCIWVGIAVAGLIFAVVPSDHFFAASSLILLANIALLMGALAFNITSSEERAAEFYLYLYFLLFYLLPGYIHLSTGRFPFYNRMYRDDYILWASLCAFLFSLSFVAAYSFAFTHQAGRYPNRLHKRGTEYVLAALYVSVALAVAFAFGIENYTVSRGDAYQLRVEYTPVTLIALSIPRILSFVAFLVSLVTLANGASLGRLTFALVTFAVFSVLNSPIAIPRFLLFAYVIILLLVFVKLTKFRKTAIAAAFFVGQLTIFPAISLLSRGNIQQLLSTSLLDYFASNGDFDGFQSTINVVRYAQEAGFHYGSNLLSAAFFFVPREFWPGKSYGTGGEAAAFNGYNFINISAPLPSEFYVDLGTFGTIVGAALFGAFLARLDGQIRAHRATGNKWELFAPATVVGYLFIILRGSLVGILGPFVLTYAIVWLSTKWTRRRPKLAERRISRGRFEVVEMLSRSSRDNPSS